MSTSARNDPLRGFAAPLDPGGQAPLYGPPPWRFHGRMLTVFLRTDPGEFAARIPAPLRGQIDPMLRVSS